MSSSRIKIVFTLSFLSCIAWGNDTLIVDPQGFSIDPNLNLILVNQDVETINSSIEGEVTHIKLDEIYTLETSRSMFNVGSAYNLKNSADKIFQLFFTELPIINIFSENEIIDEPRVHASLCITDTDLSAMCSDMGIEISGGWSQTLDKTSYRIEFWEDETGDVKKNISILGMRNDDDWNIVALYNEPLKIRSKIGYDLWMHLDELHYKKEEEDAINGVRLEYVELFLNGEYRGLYAIRERIDRKQLQLQKSEGDEIQGELYQGIGWGASTFTAVPNYNNDNVLWGGFEYKYPGQIIDWSKLHEFVTLVVNGDENTFFNNYETYFDLDNAVNYFIFLNLLRSTDNTGKNIYLGKYKKGGKYFYIPWDLDGSFGMIWNGTREDITDDILMNGFFERLLSDNRPDGFLERLETRWFSLRDGLLSYNSLISSLEDHQTFLTENGVYKREQMAWPDSDFLDLENLEYTQDWLSHRLEYLDEVFSNPSVILNSDDIELTTLDDLFIYPNPTKGDLFIRHIDHNEKIGIFSLDGSLLNEQNGESLKKINLDFLQPGTYILKVYSKSKMRISTFTVID